MMLNVLKVFFVSIVVFAGAFTASAQEKPASKWGADDTIGSANYLSAALAAKAAGLVTDGKVYALGVPVSSESPAVAPRSMAINVLMPGQYGGKTLGSNEASYLDDMISGWMGIGTQIDGLAHAGQRGEFYNGNKAIDFVTPSGGKKLGVEGIPPIVTRGILIDVAKHRGVKRLKKGQIITAAELEAAATKQGVDIQQGDVVIIHTGWISMLEENPEEFLSGEPGINRATAQYLADKKVVAVGADNWGIDAVPFADDTVFDVHVTLLYENGTYLLETLDTRALAEDEVYEFMFVLGQPRYVGAVQAVINPIAIK